MHEITSQYIGSIFELLEPNIIGFHNQFEVVTIFALPKSGGDKQPFNVLTMVVAQESEIEEFQQEKFLTPKLLNIAGIKELSFGIIKYSLTFEETKDLLATLSQKGVWEANQKSLSFSNSLELTPRILVPADATETVPLNKILKNNFWSGSYIFEWFDTKKNKLKIFFDQPDLLQKLSQELNKFIPIKLASVSDRLGNLIIQLPISLVMTKVYHSRNGNDLIFKMVWHPKALLQKQRNLIFNCTRLNDNTYQDFYSCRVNSNEIIIPMKHERGVHRYSLWDDEEKILIAASTETSFVHEVSFTSAMIEHEPRGFYVKNSNSDRQLVRISIHNNKVFNINANDNKSQELHHRWTTQRLYEHEKEDLLKQKKLIQYKRNQSDNALNDLRVLIERYGQDSVYLWDPYLAPQDILQTLFYCSHAGSDLKAITELESPPDADKQTKVNLITNYHEELEESCENKFGLKLEVRAKIGKYGWSFHDRFLIFPKTNIGPRAWSLGTSVNSLGKTHHIFQEVSDGRLIADAFEQLWVALDHQECLVWKC
ncbi:VPA1262 family N-terminal domain-containing protein [Acinetobacter seifertii]|uniref:VPA1262 family N-terminal domain-containing protein n=1 Tax=Acinetobacter seifertii TaxID=1530123 RepID=UPI003EE0A04D